MDHNLHTIGGMKLKHAVVLDIGSSKVVGLCAERVGNDGLKVHGADARTYAGYRFGVFQNTDSLQRAIVDCLLATQRECGFRLREVTVSVPVSFTKLLLGTGLIEFPSHPKRISGADIDMLINESLPKEAPEGCVLIHSTPYSYTLDGVKGPDLPQDAVASRLESEVSHVYVQEAFLAPVKAAIKSAGMQPGVCISAALAQSLMLIPGKVRQMPAILLDVGYLHTDVVVSLHSAMIAQDTVQAGGYHFAADLAYGLQVPLAVAEQVKRRYVFSEDYQDSVELMRTPEGTRSVERAQVQYILEERASELCFMIDDVIRELHPGNAPVIYLTGGGLAMMRGSREYLEHMLGWKVRKDMPWMPRMNSPNYSSVFGIVEFILHAGDDTALQIEENGMLRRFKELFVK